MPESKNGREVISHLNGCMMFVCLPVIFITPFGSQANKIDRFKTEIYGNGQQLHFVSFLVLSQSQRAILSEQLLRKMYENRDISPPSEASSLNRCLSASKSSSLPWANCGFRKTPHH